MTSVEQTPDRSQQTSDRLGWPVPGKWQQAQLTQFLNDNSIVHIGIQKKKDWPFAFITFPSEQSRSAAAEALSTQQLVPGKLLSIRDQAAPKQGPVGAKRKRQDVDVAQRDIRDSVCPLWAVPYGEQLRRKHARLAEALVRVTTKVRKSWPRHHPKPEWLAAAEARGGSCAPILGVLRSPQLEGYRNKCDFSVGLGVDEKPQVGFLLGAYKDGITAVAPPVGCRHVSAVATGYAAIFADFIREHSKLPAWDKRTNSGFWRQLLVREGRSRTFLPLPGQPTPESSAAEVSPSFDTLDWGPWLVRIPAAVATSASPAATAPKRDGQAAVRLADEIGASSGAAIQEGLRVEAAPSADAAVTDRAVVSEPTGPSAAGVGEGVYVTSVDETSHPAPLPDEVMVVVQVNDRFTNEATSAAECRSLEAFIRSQAAEQTSPLPLTALLLQLHSGISNVAPDDASTTLFPSSSDLPSAASPAPAANGETTANAGTTKGELAVNGSAAGPSKGGAEAAVKGAVAGVRENGEHSAAASDAELGRHHLRDTLCNLTFRISPSAFFQVNSGAAALMYRVAGDWAAPSPNALVFDVCCGTGSIGLTLAHRVARVVGVDTVEEAIADAKVNSALNGISNCEWLCGKAEDVLPEVLRRRKANNGSDSHSEDEVVAIVDPPRAGLHARVLQALRDCSELNRLVYVSCNPDSLATNLVDLCSGPKAFGPVKALAVDLFPHTSHCEAVVLLER